MALRLRSILQCPHCGFKVTEQMPVDLRVQAWPCPACGATVTPKPGSCCVFCAWGSVPCPAAQRRQENPS